MKDIVKRAKKSEQHVKNMQHRNKLIPAMREIFTFDYERGELVYAVDVPPRGKKGALVGTMNGRGTRQVMFGGVRYVAHEIIYAITHDQWPHKRLSFRDGSITNISPYNLYIKE
jgi:hypothetical protein